MRSRGCVFRCGLGCLTVRFCECDLWRHKLRWNFVRHEERYACVKSVRAVSCESHGANWYTNRDIGAITLVISVGRCMSIAQPLQIVG